MQTVNILLLKEEIWSAQCLEHDIAAQGKTIDEALEELSILIAAELSVADESSLKHVPPAPEPYWRAFRDALEVTAPRAFPVVPLHEVPPAFMLPEFRELRVA